MSTSAGSQLAAWLDLTRLSNLPTALSNVLVGLYLGFAVAVIRGEIPASAPRSGELLIALLAHGWPLFIAVACLYVGGMILNDIADLPVDRELQPGRPVPSGRVSRGLAGTVAAILIAAGIAISASFGAGVLAMAGLLAAAIVGYDLWHHLYPATVSLMGVSRGLVYLLAASAVPDAGPGGPVFWAVVLPPAVILGGYVVLLTAVARRETASDVGPRRRLAWLILLVAVAGPPLVVLPDTWQSAVTAIIVGVLLVIWLARPVRLVSTEPPRTGEAVRRWLAGICLLDAWFLALLATLWPPLLALLAFGVTLAAHRRIRAT